MKKIIIFCLFILSFSLFAEDAKISGDALKAKNLVKKAIAFYKANGKEKTFSEINNTKGQFVDGEFYIFVFDFKGKDSIVCLARGDGNTKLINKNMFDMQDPDGKFYIQDMVNSIKTSTSAWVDYKRSNPTNKKVEPKSSYIEKINGEDIFFGCGFYK
jgi:cytochrome c